MENTPSGNIITGFDNYMKGISGAGAQRRKTGPMEQNRVFSRSSVSYRPSTVRRPTNKYFKDDTELMQSVGGNARIYTSITRPNTGFCDIQGYFNTDRLK